MGGRYGPGFQDRPIKEVCDVVEGDVCYPEIVVRVFRAAFKGDVRVVLETHPIWVLRSFQRIRGRRGGSSTIGVVEVGVGVPSGTGVELILTLLPAGEGRRGVLLVMGLAKAPGGVGGVPAI